MSDSFELPKKPIYPTQDDILELQRIADTKATGAQIHKIKAVMSGILITTGIAEKRGWNDKLLKQYNESKARLYEILSGEN